MSIRENLIEEFNDEVKGLRGLQLGSDEYKATVDGVTKLADRIIEIEKIEKDAKSKEIERESNDYLKMKQMQFVLPMLSLKCFQRRNKKMNYPFECPKCGQKEII